MGTAGLKAVSGAFDRVPTPLPPFIRVAAGVAISGVFDHAPLQQSPHVNDKLQLTQVWGGRRGRAGCAANTGVWGVGAIGGEGGLRGRAEYAAWSRDWTGRINLRPTYDV